MNPSTIAAADVLQVSGSPHERGHLIADAGRRHGDWLRQRAAAALALLADDGAWLARQWRCQVEHLPEVTALVEGMASGFGIPVDALFAMHLRYAIEDRQRAPAAPDREGCSAIAIRRDGGGALVAKNRDNPPDMARSQLLLRQQGTMLSVGSFGGAPAASSGINADGFCLADTSVRTGDLGVGVLRYYLMEALLLRCATVAEALVLIRALPHLGGGTLVLGDAGGAIAAVEIGHSHVAVEDGAGQGWVARTNHHTDPALAGRVLTPADSAERRNSEDRLALLRTALTSAPTARWTNQDCAALLSTHADAGHPALCRHGGEILTTLSGAVYDSRDRSLLLSEGNPCGGRWRRAVCRP